MPLKPWRKIKTMIDEGRKTDNVRSSTHVIVIPFHFHVIGCPSGPMILLWVPCYLVSPNRIGGLNCGPIPIIWPNGLIHKTAGRFDYRITTQ